MIIKNNSVISSPTAVALGFFDGVHLGHVSLINKVKELNCDDVKSVIYTFDTHPSVFFSNKAAMITPVEERIKILESFSTDFIYLQQIDKDFLNLTPEEFFTEIIIKKLGAAYVVSGENYTFGKNKSGNSDLMKKLCDKHGIKYTVVPYQTYGDKIISSSLIRQLLSDGNVDDASCMLGRPFSLSGKVIRCREVGTSLGFPTANILPAENAQLPLSGVYATNTVICGKSYPSVTNVGTAPTFSQDKLIIETHILDFNENIYSQNIKIEFLKLLRLQQKFSSPELLSEQLKKDIETRRTL